GAAQRDPAISRVWRFCLQGIGGCPLLVSAHQLRVWEPGRDSTMPLPETALKLFSAILTRFVEPTWVTTALRGLPREVDGCVLVGSSATTPPTRDLVSYQHEIPRLCHRQISPGCRSIQGLCPLATFSLLILYHRFCMIVNLVY